MERSSPAPGLFPDAAGRLELLAGKLFHELPREGRQDSPHHRIPDDFGAVTPHSPSQG